MRIRIVILALFAAQVSVFAYYGCSKGPSQVELMRPDEPQVKPDEPSLKSAIPEGMRAVAIRVNDVIGFAAPGNYVDVIKTAGGRSSVLLENVQVLSNHSEILTLLVTPEDVRKLAGLRKGVRLALAVRNQRKMTTQDGGRVVPL